MAGEKGRQFDATLVLARLQSFYFRNEVASLRGSHSVFKEVCAQLFIKISHVAEAVDNAI